DRDVPLALKLPLESGDGARAHEGVAVQEEIEVGVDRADSEVVPGREPGVGRGRHDAHPAPPAGGDLPFQTLGRAVTARVVDDERREGAASDLRLEGGQALEHELRRAIVEDDDRDGNSLPRPPGHTSGLPKTWSGYQRG